ncbi:hypothetical protein [Sphingobacterium deserti]|uniref:Uncharacterized protein n=1 Tax=Sphingobacterium deserti TaxID=1229276 RepID=A0A0B8T082_9SPHI|nr:hypothetical protein [Sphingobacterium deserti]KGE13591.1 hypothetical protein DI53_2652 [Sphingobacterium deserti]
MASALAALFFSCNEAPDSAAQNKEERFDIPAYFKSEISRLNQSLPTVKKTVVKDSLSETKTIKISNWTDELASFSTVDLNKPAYSGILKKDSTAGKITYTATDPKIDVSKVEITFTADNKPKSFVIERTIKNSLYQTKEVLKYQADSAYSLDKNQSVLLLGDRRYQIESTFLP